MTLWLRTKAGETRPLEKRATVKLHKELRAGRGCAEVTALIEQGFAGYLGPDGNTWPLDELKADHIF